jgi:hypothetical protein
MSCFLENPLDCKLMHETVEGYANFTSDRVRIGLLFRSLVSDETFWKGDVCIYLGTEGLEDPLKRFWCFRSEKLVIIDSFESAQIFGVTNYPGKSWNLGLLISSRVFVL